MGALKTFVVISSIKSPQIAPKTRIITNPLAFGEKAAIGSEPITPITAP
jgi:hypothetical protein